MTDLVNEDFLALEQILIERLTDKVKDSNGTTFDVMPYTDVLMKGGTDSDEPVLRTPCFIVHYHGYTVAENGNGKARPEQLWSVSVVVSNVRDKARAGARADAGMAITAVAKLLIGWMPPAVSGIAHYSKLKLANPPFPPTYRSKNSYFPLSFTTERSIQGAC